MGNQGHRTSAKQSGMVLVLVVVLLGLVVALVLQGQVAARASLRQEDVRLRRARLQSALTDSVRQAMQVLADDELLNVDYLEEDWAQPIEINHPSGVSVVVRVTDENRFFDLNNLYTEQDDEKRRPAGDVVMDIMTLCRDFTPIERVQALKDWVDLDDEGFRESSFYLQKEEPYRCPNRWIESWSELKRVDGLSREYFLPKMRYEKRDLFEADVADCVTVLPGRRSKPVRVNVNTASREVLMGVAGLELEAWVQYILVLRTERPLVSLEAVSSAGDPALVNRVAPYLGVKSTHFRIEARAYEAGQVEQLWALVRRNEKDREMEVLRWVY